MKKCGFTLIELLGVIVVLAKSATPLILGIIAKTKVDAAKSSALGYIEAVEFYQAKTEIDDSLSRIKGD